MPGPDRARQDVPDLLGRLLTEINRLTAEREAAYQAGCRAADREVRSLLTTTEEADNA